MENVQIIKDEKGKPAFAVVPIAEYERLKAGMDEDALLIAAGNAARGDEAYPADVTRRLLAGENGLKVIREWRGLTQAKLGELAEVPSQYISQIERKDRNMGPRTATKLAEVLKVSPETLMEGQYEGGFQKVVRTEMRKPDLD